jgi:uncharacterized membrane protein
MAATAPKRRAGGARRTSAASKRAPRRVSGPAKKATKPATKATKPTAKAGTKVAKKAAKSATPGSSGVAKLLARKALKMVARTAAKSGARAIRAMTDRAAGAGKQAVDGASARWLPIQVSIDVAVPLSVAWEEWTTYEWMNEGTHRIEDVERDGDELVGHTAGPRPSDWVAEIVDEREQESFAWRSVEGSDCAGLATFHRLSERLTRIELDLDVVPKTPIEAVALTTHLAHHRAEAELRRFKAAVEFINPDVYENDEEQENEPEARD